MKEERKPVSELSATTLRTLRYRARHLYVYLMFEHTRSDRMKDVHEMHRIESRLGIKAKDIKAGAQKYKEAQS